MGIQDNLYKDEKRQEQRLLENWAEFDEAEEKRLSEMEEQTKSPRWKELKNEIIN